MPAGRPKFDWSKATINEARDFFEKNRRNCKLTFNELLTLFQDDCKTLVDIAEIAGVTPQQMTLHFEHLKQFIPRRPSGRMRRKICTRKRRIELYGTAQNSIKDHSPTGLIAALCELKGLRYCQLKGSDGKFKKYFIKINNYQCGIRFSKNTINNYWKMTRTSLGEKCDFVIWIIIEENKILFSYVFPSEFTKNLPEAIYVRDERVESAYKDRNMYRLYDFSLYREAWHLLL